MSHANHSAKLRAMQLALAGCALLLLLSSRSAHAVSGRQTYYVPMSTDEIQQSFEDLNDGGATIHNVISISVSEANSIIYYDQWEDGYEADIVVPTQASTQVWGDGNLTNGVLAGFPADIFQAGDIVSLINDIPTPRNINNLFFDSRDKFFITSVAAVTFYAWPTNPGSVLAGAAEVYETSEYGQFFISPVGEDTINTSMFEYSAISVMAAEDDTELEIDADADGTTETFVTIDEGETYFTTGGVNQGASIFASKPVQAHLIVGEFNADYECDWFTLFPVETWSNVYYNPAYTTVVGADAQITVFNHNAAQITVEVTNGLTTSNLTVNSGGINTFDMPFGIERGVRVRSLDNSRFYAIVAMDEDSATWDWGATLIPEGVLTPSILVGWGDGGLDLNSNNIPDENSAPVWVMVLKNTTLYVDYDGDPLTGPLTDPIGNKVDQITALNKFEARRLRDNSDNSQTGLRAYTLDGTLIVAAWGEDPSNASAGQPGIDAGTAILPIPVVSGDKTFSLEDDADNNSLVSPGDLIRFTIDVKNDVGITIADVSIFDDMPEYFSYVPGSTQLNSAPLADDSVPPAATAFPLDESGLFLNTVPFGMATTLTFVAEITGPIASGATTLGNGVEVDSPFGEFDTDTSFTFSADPDLQIIKTARNANAGSTGSIYYDLFYTNTAAQSTTGVLIVDHVPANTTFDAANSDPRWAVVPNNDAGSTCTLFLGSVEGNNLTSGTVAIAFQLNSPFPDQLVDIVNTATIEDDGSNGPDLNPEDNESSATVIAGFPRITKTIIATSVNETSDSQVVPGLADLTIGEEVLFQLTTTLREGVSTGVVVADLLPSFPGFGVLELIPTSTTVVSIGGNLSPAIPNPAPNIQDLVDPFGLNDTVDFFFGTVNNTPDGIIDQNDRIVINIGARVVNLTDSISSLTLENNAIVLDNSPYTDSLDVVMAPFDIVEPNLQITKSVSVPLAANGQAVTYQVIIGHTGVSIADAFDLAIEDLLTSNLNLVAGSVTASTGTIVTGNTSGDTAVAVSLSRQSLNAAPVTITYQAVVSGLAPGNSTINTAGLTYDSLPTEGNPNEREYATSDTATVTAYSPDAAVDIDDFGATTTPGGTVNYTVTYNNPGNADLTGVTITHIVPAHTTFNPGASTSGWVLTPNDDAGSTATFTVGDLDIAATGSLILTLNVDTPLTSDVVQVAARVSITDDGASGPDVNLSNNSDIEPTPITTAPSLTVTKIDTLTDTDGSGNFTASDTLTYTIVITNTGNTILGAIVLNDTPDTNTILTTGTVATSQGTVALGNGTSDTSVVVNVGSLSTSETATITFDVKLVEGLTSATLFVANQAFVDTDQTKDEPSDDPDTTPSNDPTRTPIGFSPLLIATKIDSFNEDVDGSNDISPGDTLIYQVVVENIGTTAALNVVFTDTPGTHTVLVPGSVFTDPLTTVTLGNTPGDTSVQVEIGTLAADASTTLAFVVAIANPLPTSVTFVQNQGLVVSDEFSTGVLTDDPDTSTPDDPTVTPVAAAPDMAIFKDDGGASTAPGGTVAYTLTYFNLGTQDATGVVITDTVPANTTFNPGASTAGWVAAPNNNAGSTLTLAVGSVNAGNSGNATVAFNVVNPVPAGVTQILNTTSIADDGANGPDSDPGNNNDADDTPLAAAPDLVVTKTDNGVSVRNGDAIVYTITYQNVGNQDATGVIVSDIVPSRTTFLPGSSTPGWIAVPNTSAGSTCNFVVGNLAAGGFGTLLYVVSVNAVVPPSVTQITNTVTIADDGNNGADPTPANNTATENTPLTIVPGINVTKTWALLNDADSTGDVTEGDTLSYSIAIINTGSIDLEDVVFNDTPDAHSALISGSVSASQGTVVQGNTAGDASIQVNAGDIPASNTVTITYQTLVGAIPIGVTQLVNQGLASGTNFPDEPSDDPLTGGDNDPTVVPLGQIPLIDVIKSDSLLIDADSSGGATGGDTLRYTVEISNNGSGPASSVTFSDIPDANTTLVVGSVTASLGAITSGNSAGNTGVGVSIGSIAANSSVTITFDVTINDPVPGGVTQVANQGQVAGSNFEPQPSDDPDTGAQDDPTITPLQGAAAIMAIKRDFIVLDADNDGGASAGDTLRYLVTISNPGGVNVSGVVFEDTPDTNTTLVAGSVTVTGGTIDSGGTAGDTTVQVTIGNLIGGTSVGITFDVTINDPLPLGVAQISNQGIVTSTNLPPVVTDDPDTPAPDDPTLTPLPVVEQLEADKSDALLIDTNIDGAAGAGDTLRYTVVIRNTGSANLTNVIFTDTPGLYTTLVSGSVVSTGTVTSGNGGGDTDVAVTYAALPAGESRIVQFDVLITTSLPQNVTQVENQGLVEDDSTISVPTNDPDTLTPGDPTVTPVVGAPVLVADKSDSLLIDANSNGLADPGDTLRYTIIISNTGLSPTDNVVFKDTPDTNTTLIAGSVTTTQGFISIGNNIGATTVEVTLLPIGAGENVVIQFNVRINTGLPGSVTMIRNQGHVWSFNPGDTITNDPETANPLDPTLTPLGSNPGVDAGKADALLIDTNNDGLAGSGDRIRYTIRIFNYGFVNVPGVVYDDQPDTYTVLINGSVTTTQGSIVFGNAGGDTLVNVMLGTLNAHSAVTIVYDVDVVNSLPGGLQFISNQGTVGTNGTLADFPTDDPDTFANDDPTLTALQPVVNQAFFAEGDVRGEMETYLLVVNPSPTEAAFFQIVFYFEDREPLVFNDLALPHMRKSYNIRDLFQVRNTAPATFGVKIDSTSGAPFFAERSMYWNPGGIRRGAGTDSAGETQLRTDWHLAEGSTTGNRETMVLIANPGFSPANLRVTWLLQNGSPVVTNLVCPAQRRLTLNAADYVGSADFSVRVESLNNQGVVVERTMYGPANGISRKWGHNVMGCPGVSSRWFFAEGAVHASFETFLLLENPNAYDVATTVRYLNDNALPVTQLLTLPAQSRTTINVEAQVPGMQDRTFAIEVTTANNYGIVAERSMYWKSGSFTQRSGATATAGATQSSVSWYLPEGAIWGSSQFEEFILIGNTGAFDADIRVTCIDPNGNATVATLLTVPAGERRTVKVNNYFAANANTVSVSALIESTNGAPVVVERAMYWSTADTPRIEGHSSTGIRR